MSCSLFCIHRPEQQKIFPKGFILNRSFDIWYAGQTDYLKQASEIYVRPLLGDMGLRGYFRGVHRFRLCQHYGQKGNAACTEGCAERPENGGDAENADRHAESGRQAVIFTSVILTDILQVHGVYQTPFRTGRLPPRGSPAGLTYPELLTKGTFFCLLAKEALSVRSFC